MKKFALMLSVAFFLTATIAHAHGPVRQKVKEKIKIDAAPDKIWSIIKDFGDISWLPAVSKTTHDGGNKKGATRVLTLKDGGTISEELKKYKEDKMEYAYKITDMSTVKTIKHSGADVDIKVLPVSNYAATITVKKKGSGSEVTWKAGFYRGYMNNKPPAELNEDAANSAVTAVFKEGLENLKKLAE
ncbi:MAG: SRPBCC family protein [Methylococcaceae bacterium]